MPIWILEINKCVKFPPVDCNHCSLLELGEHERHKEDFLPIGPRRCTQECEDVWNNISKRHYKTAIPACIKGKLEPLPLSKEHARWECPPACKYDYKCTDKY